MKVDTGRRPAGVETDAAVGLVLLLVAVFALRVRPLFDPDWWWHLSVGRAVLAAGSRVVPEPTAFQGPPTYVDPEWAFDVFAVGLWSVGGVTGAILFTAVCATLSALLVAVVAQACGSDDRGSVMLAGLAAASSGWHFTPRPQSLQMVLTPLVLALGLHLRRHDARGRLRILVALHLTLGVWAQVHTSVAVAPVITWLAVLPLMRGEPRLAPRDLVGLGLLAVWPFTGPFGLHIVDQVLRHTDAADATRYIRDMEPGSFRALFTFQQAGAPELLWMLGLGVVALLRWRRLAPGPLLLFLLGAAMMSTANRFEAVWAVMSVPLVATARSGATTHPIGFALALAAVPFHIAVERNILGFGLDHRQLPVDLGETLAERGVEGRIFTDYADAGYLGWRLAPTVKIFIDGRTPVHFDADDLYAYRRGVRDLGVLERLDDVYGFAAVALTRDRPVCAAVASSTRFAPVWRDAHRVLFLKGAVASVDDPCLDPVDPTPRRGDAGASHVDAWDVALGEGRAADVRAEAEAVVRDHGHEVAPEVRLRLARACAALVDADCVGSQAWRAALEGVDAAVPLLRAHVQAMTGSRRAHVEALLAAPTLSVDGGAPAAP